MGFSWQHLGVLGVALAVAIALQQNPQLSDLQKQNKIEALYQKLARNFSEVPEITVEELQQLPKEAVVLVDVRPLKERVVSTIPGAISTEEFEANLHSYRQYPIVVYCTIGYRSGYYAQKMAQEDLDIYNLRGSLLAWSHIDGKLTNRFGDTKQIHVYSKKWQLAADGYEAMW